ncbi:MAG: hypothetical protein ABIO04_13615 [Ferruginibacter sp.]
MKKLITITMVIITNFNTKAQKLDVVVSSLQANNQYEAVHRMQTEAIPKDYDYYMKRRKINKMVGWSLLGGGLLFSGVGLILAATVPSYNYNDPNSYNSVERHDNATGVCLVVGAVAGIASIPFMIIATANHNKAKLLMTEQKTGAYIPAIKGNIKGLTLAIRL